MPDFAVFFPFAASWWSGIFLVFLAANLLVKFWLAQRHMRHVLAHQHAVPPAFAGAISPQAHSKAAAYTVAKTRFDLWQTLYGAALLVGWTLLGGLSALNQWVLNWTTHSLWQPLALLGAFALINGLLELPWSWYSTFRLEAHFGFNTTTPALWWSDLAKSAALGLVIGAPIAALVLWLMQQAGGLWWLWAWALWVGFGLLMMVIYPTWIAPLFNQFKPLDDPALVQRVTALMQRCGFSAKGLFVMDGSKRSAHANAYFTGLGNAKRVVFFDTLLNKLLPGEVDAVLAHELGHFKRKHVTKRMVSMFAFSLAGFALLGYLYGAAWFYTGLGVTVNAQVPQAALALLLFMLVLPVFLYFVAPLSAHVSRKHEFEADAYAVQHSSGADLAAALLKLYEDNASTLTPDPLYVQFYYSHPPASERLARLQGAVPTTLPQGA